MIEDSAAFGGVQVRAWRLQSHPIWLYRAVQLLLGWLVRLLFRTSREGHRRIPRHGPVILASNHASNIDPVLVVACMPRPIFHLGKHHLFNTRFTRFFLEAVAGQIPVDRGMGGNQAAVEAGILVLRRGLALGIYPEGTRTADGSIQSGQTGVAIFAYRTGVPVYPIAIQGTYQVWPKHRRLPRLFRRTRVMVGNPIQVSKDPVSADDPRRCRQLTDRIMAELARLTGLPFAQSRLPVAMAKTQQGRD